MEKIAISPPRTKPIFDPPTADRIEINPFPRPSLIPGVESPTTEREERLMDAAYAKGCRDTSRLYEASKSEDPMLTAMREAVNLIRKDKGLE